MSKARYYPRRFPEWGWCVWDRQDDRKVWPEGEYRWATSRRFAAAMADEMTEAECV